MMFLCALCVGARAETLYVDDSAGAGGDGSLGSPLADLQDAVDNARDGDEILVAGGSYGPIEVALVEITISGGYSADFSASSPSTPSVIEGDPSGPAVSMFEVGETVLEGLTIRGGERGISLDADWQSTTNRPTIRGNIIENNGLPSLSGGGIFALHCGASIVGNVVRDNVGDRGSGIATACDSILIEGNTVEGNVSHGDHGGGLYLTGPSIEVRENLIRDNEVGYVIGYGWGAGVTVYGQGVFATFERNVFTANRAPVGSGAFVDDGAQATFTGDLFYDNGCDMQGAALYVDGYSDYVSSHAALMNVTIADHRCINPYNSSIYVEAQSSVTFENSILWNNDGTDFLAVDAASSIAATYTLSDESIEGEGNLVGDPLFADPEAGDFHVLSTEGRFDPQTGTFVKDTADSPTIDAGDPSADVGLEPGPNGLRINLGHTGGTPEASMGGPGGTPPSETGTDSGEESQGYEENSPGEAGPERDPKGELPESGCGCRSTARPQGLWAASLGILALSARRGRR